MRYLTIGPLVVSALACGANAQVLSLLGESGRGVFAVPGRSETQQGPHQQSPALFVGRAPGGLFADPPAHKPVYPYAPVTRLSGTDVEILRALIQEAESRRMGYDAVQWGARVRPSKRPTQMTLAEIYQWINETPGQPHAIGRYQFIPSTLRRVVKKTGMPLDQRFDAQVQDALADVLLAEAGLQEFRKGKLSRRAFMNNLAKIWAGFPNSTGKSHYHGYAGNKASISWARFDTVMREVEKRRG